MTEDEEGLCLKQTCSYSLSNACFQQANLNPSSMKIIQEDNMPARVQHLKTLLKKLGTHAPKEKIQSVVFMDSNGDPMFEDGIQYNKSGVLLVPKVLAEDWESFFQEQAKAVEHLKIPPAPKREVRTDKEILTDYDPFPEQEPSFVESFKTGNTGKGSRKKIGRAHV